MNINNVIKLLSEEFRHSMFPYCNYQEQIKKFRKLVKDFTQSRNGLERVNGNTEISNNDVINLLDGLIEWRKLDYRISADIGQSIVNGGYVSEQEENMKDNKRYSQSDMINSLPYDTLKIVKLFMCSDEFVLETLFKMLASGNLMLWDIPFTFRKQNPHYYEYALIGTYKDNMNGTYEKTIDLILSEIDQLKWYIASNVECYLKCYGEDRKLYEQIWNS